MVVVSGEDEPDRGISVRGTPYSFGNPEALCRELIGVGMYGPKDEAEEAALLALELDNDGVRGIALTALGHYARVNRDISGAAIGAVSARLAVHERRGNAENAGDDICMVVFGGDEVPGVIRD